MSKLVIAFCTAQAIGQKAHTENGVWTQSNSRERGFSSLHVNPFLEGGGRSSH